MKLKEREEEMDSEYIGMRTAPRRGMEGVPQMHSYDEALEWYEENTDNTYSGQTKVAISGGVQEELERSMTESRAVDTLLEEGAIEVVEELIIEYYEEAPEVTV